MRYNSRQRTIGRFIVLNLILLIAALIWNMQPDQGMRLAMAKSGQTFYSYTLPTVPLDRGRVQNLFLSSQALHPAWRDDIIEFVEAVPLTFGESRTWANAGCEARNCAHATFYNYSLGGTVEAVVNLDTDEVVATWQNELARPSGSSLITEQVMEIAAADTEVQTLLGDIHSREQAMIPMSAWLMDDACADEWCVDLTFHDPAGTGRIVHVFVNVEQERVARIFYTRAREDIPAAAPQMQRFAFTDDCIEQDGWSVCWEMTAHDGVLFRDASFNEQPVFASVKIGQVEAWYPSWPGGYRDEIGFNASVPPFGDTQVTELEDGFEVRQLFTEFTHWPNCICCYRYEEIMRFHDDGSFEPRFVSHGPGCDDLSIYRPFWRIDVDVAGPDGDSVALWEDGAWTEVREEFELFPVVDDVAPDGTRLGTRDGDVLYTWEMFRTDPLGLDEARLFVLAHKEEEGDGPVLPGPGDTFQPPRQWIDEESVMDNNIVVWFVPLLKTKKSNPLWCMPDPEPGINQCEAVLRVAPAAELREPELEEVAATRDAPVGAEPVVTATPTAVPTPAPSPTPRPVQGDDAADLILNAGCGACHTIGAMGEARKVGPDLTNIAAVAGERVAGLSASEYLRQSIVEPNAYITPDCPNGPCMPNIMPQYYGERLTAAQIDLIVNFLLTEVETAAVPAPIGADAGEPTPRARPAAKTTPVSPLSDDAPAVAIQILLVTLVFLLTLFRLAKD